MRASGYDSNGESKIFFISAFIVCELNDYPNIFRLILVVHCGETVGRFRSPVRLGFTSPCPNRTR
jgi:hypothetical protein